MLLEGMPTPDVAVREAPLGEDYLSRNGGQLLCCGALHLQGIAVCLSVMRFVQLSNMKVRPNEASGAPLSMLDLVDSGDSAGLPCVSN